MVPQRRCIAGSAAIRTDSRSCWHSVVSRIVIALVLGGLLVGCAGRPVASRRTIADDLRNRTGHSFAGGRAERDFSPLHAAAALSESDAIDLALTNNAAFAEQLADLGVTRADVVQAGLIANPDAVLLIPVGPKQLEATITAPLESLWLRGPRTHSAQLSNDRNAARLTQAGLDLIRDVRWAYAELALARRKVELARETLADRQKVLDIAASRIRAGDAGPLDSATARVELLLVRRDAQSLQFAQEIAEERLRALLGAGAIRVALKVEALPPDDRSAEPDVEMLVRAALASRPDLRAAEIAVESARLRASLARCEWLNLAFIADANERGSKGFEAGPGFRFTLPIFNQNQGAIARADAELERAIRGRRTLIDKVILETREAHVRYRLARSELAAWRTDVRPALEQAYELARRAYERGATPQVQVLDTNRQLLDARAREAQAAADARKAWAELERSVGRRLDVAGTPPAFRPASNEAASSSSAAAGPSRGFRPLGPQNNHRLDRSSSILRNKPANLLGDGS
jgi:cobalt-zinc-cadmium efflux system outer membrane protein